MSGFGRRQVVTLTDLAPPPFDPAYMVFLGGQWIYAPPPGGGGIQNNFSAVADPGINDDSSSGYSVGSMWVNTATGTTWQCVNATLGAAQWVQTGPSTGGSTSGNEEALTVDFSFADLSPVVVGTLAAGDRIISTELQILTVFDDPAATLALGTPVQPGEFLGVNENVPTRLGLYGSDENYDIGALTSLRLTISPGLSTQGSGQVMVTVRRA